MAAVKSLVACAKAEHARNPVFLVTISIPVLLVVAVGTWLILGPV